MILLIDGLLKVIAPLSFARKWPTVHLSSFQEVSKEVGPAKIIASHDPMAPINTLDKLIEQYSVEE